MYRIITLLVTTGLVIAHAQSFEVASVKVPPAVSGDLYNINLGTIQHDTVTLTNVLLADCIKFAYGLSLRSDPIRPQKLRVAAKDGPASVPTGVQGQLRIVSNRMPMTTVVSLLSRYMRAFVVDQTGLAGDLEVNLVWTPDDRPIPDDERGPSVFTAVEEQLGLKLVSRKGPMEVLVVDRAEKTPTEN
jgi:hypothetical protein